MEQTDMNRIMEMRMAESLQIATPSEGGESAQTSEQTNRQPKRRRGLPGTPDPEAEVVALSPKSLLETNKYGCDICGKGFQREQNLHLHRRGHNLPWKLKQRERVVRLWLHTGNKEKEPPLSLSLATPYVYPSTNKALQICSPSSSSAAHDHRRDNDISSELSLSVQPFPPMMFSTNPPTLDLLGLGRGANQFGMASSSSSSGGVLGDTRDDNADKKPWFL